MEKILINSVDKKFGKPNAEGHCTPFWAVVFNHSDKATVWEESIATHMNANLNGYVMAEITPGTFKGQPIKNIRQVDLNLAPAEPAAKVAQPTPAAQKEKPNPQRVGLYIKLAVKMMIAAPINEKNIEENLCENVQEIKKLEEFTYNLLSQ